MTFANLNLRLLAASIVLTALTMHAARYQSGDFVFDCNYSWGELSATLLRYTGTASEVVVPSSVTFDGKEYPIIYIGDDFSAPFRDNTTVQRVTLPDHAVSVSAEAFSNCAQLAEIDLGFDLVYIGDYAFYHCPQLCRVVIHRNVAEIGERAFADCPSLTDITLGRNVSRLGSYIFDRTPLRSMRLLGTVPATCVGQMSSQPSLYTDCQLTVHIGTLPAYGQDAEWSRFAHITDRAELGDINADGLTDVGDSNVMTNIILGRKDAAQYVADINRDGVIDVYDSNMLINIILGKIEVFD